MITATALVDGQTWTITGDDQPNALIPDPQITATSGSTALDINCQYRQIVSVDHAATCEYGTSMSLSARCTCTPAIADPAPLFDAARAVLLRCMAARKAAQERREADYEAAQDANAVYRPTYPVRPGCDCPDARYGGVCTCC
jgi:hypothetical protein